jgi:hypothetical protein
VVRNNSVRLQSLTDTRGKPSAYPLYIHLYVHLYVHCRLTGTARNRWTRASGIDKLGAEMDQRVLPTTAFFSNPADYLPHKKLNGLSPAVICHLREDSIKAPSEQFLFHAAMRSHRYS